MSCNDTENPKLIAFHLPQYHSIPENDEWWGEGFTEWTNVRKAEPLFPGHYQPHVPAGLGYYDLGTPDTLKAQADMARNAGITGFCFYHYWFDGKLLLEKPLHTMLESGEPDFPFCLCWANEPWTRAWDGKSGEILMEQNYHEESELEHIRYLSRFFQDRRYIRIEGKPLFLVYRVKHIPDPLRMTGIWREEARKLGIGELFLCRVECSANEHDEPTHYGFDAAVEFQPDWSALGEKLDDPQFGSNSVYRYNNVVLRMLSKPEPHYKRFPCVTPSWDNSPRRKSSATIFVDSSPQLYQLWLTVVLQRIRAKKTSENLVFINAWNEWGEGNHLEPDRKFGNGYLQATKEALADASGEGHQLLFTLLNDSLELQMSKTREADAGRRKALKSLEAAEAGNKALSEMLAEQKAAAAAKENESTVLQGQLQEVSSRLAAREEEILQLQEQLVRERAICDEEIGRRDGRIREAVQEIDDLRSSASWKLTAPLRTVYETLVRLKRP